MKTGFDLVGEEDLGEEEIMQNIGLLLILLKRDALDTARRFARSCGRDEAGSVDMFHALKFEAMTFLNKPGLKERFDELRQSLYAPSSEESDESEEEEPTPDESEPDASLICVRDFPFHRNVMQVSEVWDAWSPEEASKKILKQAVESTIEKFS